MVERMNDGINGSSSTEKAEVITTRIRGSYMHGKFEVINTIYCTGIIRSHYCSRSPILFGKSISNGAKLSVYNDEFFLEPRYLVRACYNGDQANSSSCFRGV